LSGAVNNSATACTVQISTAASDGSTTGASGVSYILWGAQLVQGSVPGDYQVTTSAAAAVQYSDPNGTRTAELLTAVAGTAILPRIETNYSTITDVTYTASLYIKPNTYTFAQIYIVNQGSDWANFTLSGAGTATAYGACTANIEAVGNGFYRISITYKAGSTDRRAYFMLAASATSSRAQAWNPVGTESVYVWGAQLSNSASVDSYVYNPQAAPTSTAYYGPRFDYNPTGTPVLSGTELVTNGTFDSGTTGWSATGSAVLSVASGALRVTNGAAVTGGTTQTINTVAGVTYSWTYYVDPATSGGAVIRVRDGGTLTVISTATRTVAGVYTILFVATGSTTQINCINSSSSIGVYQDVDNISVQAVTGYTATANGLLIEEQRTNLLTYSEDFSNAAWSAISAKNVVSNSAVAPDGTTTADTLSDNSSVAFEGIQQGTTVAVGTQTYTASCYVRKTTGGTSATFGFNMSITGGTTVGISPRLNTDTGVAIGGSGSVQDAGNYWRLSASVTNNNTAGNTNLSLSIYPATGAHNSGTDVVTATGSAIVWGAQLEAGSFATSYIGTVASQVTRAADNASMLGDNFATWYRQDQGTLVIQATPNAVPADVRFASIDDGTSINRIMIWGSSTSSSVRYEVISGGVNQVALTFSGTLISNSTFKAAATYALNNFAFSVNGGAALTDSAGILPVVVKALAIGGSSTAVFGSNLIRSISYYPTALPPATLQSITS